jgi:hypothetical protein
MTAGLAALDARLFRLHAAGWSVGETHVLTDAGPVWQVDGRNGENVILGSVYSQARIRAICSRTHRP